MMKTRATQTKNDNFDYLMTPRFARSAMMPSESVSSSPLYNTAGTCDTDKHDLDERR